MPAKSSKTKKRSKQAPPEEPVWTYRGYRLKTSEFVGAMAHFFRAEVSRANIWRQRLDTTTNWAVIVTGATLSIAFGQTSIHHAIIILNTLLVSLFLFIEARRYRYYELWSYRVRLMETDFFAAMLVPPFQPSPEWAESIAANLLAPSFPISKWEALGRRLRRNYLWIFIILYISWVAKIWLFPHPPENIVMFINRAAIEPIPGEIIILLGLVFYLITGILAISTITMTRATGEILPRFGGKSSTVLTSNIEKTSRIRSWFTQHRRRRELLTLIITNKAEAVSKRILADMNRGVTALDAKGMYTGKKRSLLFCAITVTEVHNLKAAVVKEDSQAFVIVSPAQEILGYGFNPLQKE